MAQLNFPAEPEPGEEPELSQIDLASGHSDDVSDASTIYDPAAFSVDPKYKEEMERAEAEKRRREEMGEDEQVDIANSVASPVPGKNPFRQDDEENEVVFDESPTCCCGMISLRWAVILSNGLLSLLGVVTLAVGIISFADRQRHSSEGFNALEALLLSGPFYISISCCVAGVALIGLGAVGLFLSNEIVSGRADKTKKLLFLVYQSVLILTVIVFTLLTILNAVAIAKVQSKEMYDSGHWIGTIRKAPKTICEIERRLKCAGFDALDQCTIQFDTESQRWCPGHFCADFCRVGGDQSENPVSGCDACRDGFNYVGCRDFEIENSPKVMCKDRLNDNISSSYNSSLLVLIVSLFGAILALCVAGFRGCCMPPLEQ